MSPRDRIIITNLFERIVNDCDKVSPVQLQAIMHHVGALARTVRMEFEPTAPTPRWRVALYWVGVWLAGVGVGVGLTLVTVARLR